MAKIQIKNSFITSSADITISSSLVKFSGGISAKNITGSFSGSIPQLSSYFKQGGNSFGTTATLGTNDNQALVFETNGSTRMYISGSGNVGIGTSSPSFKLHTAGAGFIGRQNSYGSYDAADADLIISNYNVDNTSKVSEIKNKIKETFIEKYGGHPMHNEIVKGKVKETCLERYGCHPAQRPEIQEQIQKSGKTYKCYTMPSGELRQIQGYEHFALDILVKEYTEEHIKSNRRDVPRILYEYNNKQKYYFPDIYLPHMNLIIEVKSTWIYKKEEEKNQIKAAAARAQGYQFEFWIFNNKGVRIQQ